MQKKKPKKRLPLQAIALSVIGLAIFVAIFAHSNMASIGKALHEGRMGLVAVVLWRMVPIAAAAAAWQRMLPDMTHDKPGLLPMSLYRWISESINNLLPVAQVGGDVVRARLLQKDLFSRTQSMEPTTGAACVVADVTIALVTQLLFALIGASQIVFSKNSHLSQVLIGLGIALLPILAFGLVQYFGIAGWVGRSIDWLRIKKGGRNLSSVTDNFQSVLASIYKRPSTVIPAALLQFLTWFLRAVEIWIAFRFFGHPIVLGDAVLIESMLNIVRSAGFAIPGGLGLQEGALILICSWVAIPTDLALALAVMKRAREILIGIPGIIAWLILESPVIRRILHRLR